MPTSWPGGRGQISAPRIPALAGGRLTLPAGGGHSVADVGIWTGDVKRTGPSGRRIGVVGTAARIVVGLALLAGVLIEQVSGSGPAWSSWLLGLIGLPAGVLGGLWLRSRRTPRRLEAGRWGHALTTLILVIVFLPRGLLPGLSVLATGVLIFLGTSMLLAAARGYAGCEVLAVPNWLLHRDDQVGCMLFTPIDRAEQRRRRSDEPRDR